MWPAKKRPLWLPSMLPEGGVHRPQQRRVQEPTRRRCCMACSGCCWLLQMNKQTSRGPERMAWSGRGMNASAWASSDRRCACSRMAASLSWLRLPAERSPANLIDCRHTRSSSETAGEERCGRQADRQADRRVSRKAGSSPSLQARCLRVGQLLCGLQAAGGSAAGSPKPPPK